MYFNFSKNKSLYQSEYSDLNKTEEYINRITIPIIIEIFVYSGYERGNALVSWQRARFPKVAGDFAFYFSASPRNESSLRGKTGGATMGCLLTQNSLKSTLHRFSSMRGRLPPPSMHAFSRGNTYCIYVDGTTTLCKYVPFCEPGKFT